MCFDAVFATQNVTHFVWQKYAFNKVCILKYEIYIDESVLKTSQKKIIINIDRDYMVMFYLIFT